MVPYIPGTGAENLLRALARSDTMSVLTDRLGAQSRHDGLSADQRPQIENGLGEGTLQLFRRRYWRALDRLKLPSGRLVLDVLPSLEWVQYAALSAALPQGRVLAFVRDPRDTLLHWIAYGTTPARAIGKPELAANYLLRQYQHLDRMRASAGLAVSVIRAEEFDADRNVLRERLAQALALRSRIVLECASGAANTVVAERIGVSRPTVGKWRARFVEARLDGLVDDPRPGRPATVTVEQVLSLIHI